MEQNQKPLCLRIEDAKKEIAEVINRHKNECGLPFFILELIVKDLYTQVLDGKKIETEVMRQNYEKAEAKEGE